MAGDPYALPNPLALLLIVLLGSVTAPTLAGYALVTVVRRGVRGAGAAVTARYLAALTAAGAIAMYAWGALHLLVDETAAAQKCKEAVGPEHAGDIAGYEPSFIPLGFECRVEGVGTYEALVPGYVNPAVYGLALLAFGLAVCAGIASSGSDASHTSPTRTQS